jgi:HTH-type transcriptional regulator/antitoxin HigA
MAKTLQNAYRPESVSLPGETLLEALETLEMSQAELARRMGRPVKTINEIIEGKAAITAETALQLEQVLRIPVSFWLKREQQFRESHVAHCNELKRRLEWKVEEE